MPTILRHRIWTLSVHNYSAEFNADTLLLQESELVNSALLASNVIAGMDKFCLLEALEKNEVCTFIDKNLMTRLRLDKRMTGLGFRYRRHISCSCECAPSG